MTIWLTSDWHFNHDKEFVYKPRGFSSVEEMNREIVQRYNSCVKPEDEVYVLGDCMLGGGSEGARSKGLELIAQLNGKLHIILGNHDTDARAAAYNELPNVVEVTLAKRMKYNGYHFYMAHYPTMTSNLEKETLKQMTLDLYGHTHQVTDFYNEIPFMYHVGLDSHDCFPIDLDTIIDHIKYKARECIREL